MKWSPARVDAVRTRAADGSDAGRSASPRTGTLVRIARAAAHDRISAGLRDARERVALSEQEVVDLLYARGVATSLPALERWERTGGIRLEEAVELAAVYHMSVDELAGRRSWNGRFLGSVERSRPDAD